MSNIDTLPDEKHVGVLDVDINATDSDGSSNIESFTALVAEDHKHDIKLRTMSWQKVSQSYHNVNTV